MYVHMYVCIIVCMYVCMYVCICDQSTHTHTFGKPGIESLPPIFTCTIYISGGVETTTL